MMGAYSKDLRLRLGAAWTARKEQQHPQRVAKRNAERTAKEQRRRERAA